ncbi:hypothetical protein G6F65_022902 [Rhizopus arrhizus]|nr:hypothetical protein G6F65_022902 [Rhizopus arrhizus]
MLDVCAHGGDHAGGFKAQAVRQRMRIQARAEIDIDEIQAGGVLFDRDFIGGGRQDFHLDQLQDFGTTVLLDTNCLDEIAGHAGLLSWEINRV